MGWVFGQVQGAWFGPLLWSGWLSSSSTATPHRFIHITLPIFLFLTTATYHCPAFIALLVKNQPEQNKK